MLCHYVTWHQFNKVMFVFPPPSTLTLGGWRVFCVCVLISWPFSSECEMGQREVWRSGAEHRGTTDGLQGSALRPDGSSAGQTEGHGEGRHSEGTPLNHQVHVRGRCCPARFISCHGNFWCLQIWSLSDLTSNNKCPHYQVWPLLAKACHIQTSLVSTNAAYNDLVLLL